MMTTEGDGFHRPDAQWVCFCIEYPSWSVVYGGGLGERNDTSGVQGKESMSRWGGGCNDDMCESLKEDDFGR